MRAAMKNFQISVQMVMQLPKNAGLKEADFYQLVFECFEC